MKRLVLLRHGESIWNRENRFTGWTDVPLSEKGCAEAQAAGRLLADAGMTFDVAYTSLLKRAIKTLWIVLEHLDLMWIPVCRSWRLNERHYGALQGLDKDETRQRHGAAQVHQWRRGYAIRPPALRPGEGKDPGQDPRYAGLSPDLLPRAESLKDTLARFFPYWLETIAPVVRSGRRVLIVAHGNSLRALVKHLDQVPDADIPHLEIPTGVPLVYELEEDMRPLRHYYLGDADAAVQARPSGRIPGTSRED